jgi:biotin carboxyl carrier protein
MKYLVTLDGRTWEVSVEGTQVSVGGRLHQAELRRVDGTPLRVLTLDGRTWSFPMQGGKQGRWSVHSGGEPRELQALDEREAQIQALTSTRTGHVAVPALKAPMPGLVVRVLAHEGQKVVEGTSLIVLEAMKMENELKAAAPGVVERVTVTPGRTVEKGEVLISFQPA